MLISYLRKRWLSVKDTLHKTSSSIVAKTKPNNERPSVIVLEDLNATVMVKNRRVSKTLADASMSALDRKITYKAEWFGSKVERVSRWYPSSKLCSSCGSEKATLSLSERMYHCESCGMVKDRDLNVSVNLKNTASSAGI